MNEQEVAEFASSITAQQMAQFNAMLPSLLAFAKQIYQLLTPEQKAKFLLDLTKVES